MKPRFGRKTINKNEKNKCEWKTISTGESISTEKIYLAKLKINARENRRGQNNWTNKKCPPTLENQKNSKSS